MESSAAQGFVQGFAGTLAPIILERKKEARDYFNKQVEYARTTGLQNRQKVRQEADATLGVARQLEAIGVPKEVIMAQVNQDPNGLGAFYQGIDKLNVKRASQGLPALTSEEISAMVNVGGNFKAPDEDLATFVTRTYEPLSRAVRDPGFSANPENSLWASMMGYSAMDEARAELGNTVIAEGMTAEDLINYGDAQPQKIGGQAVVTTNYAGLPADDIEQVKPNEAKIISEAVKEVFEANTALAAMAINGAEIPEAQIDEIVADIARSYPTIPPDYIQGEVEGYITRRGGSVGASTAPVDETGIGDSPEPPPPSGEAPVASGEGLSSDEVEAIKTTFGIVSVVDMGNGQATVTYSDGTTETGSIAQLREELAKVR